MGQSAYSIAKALNVSLAVLRNLKAWIAKASPQVLTLTREAGFLETMPPPPPLVNAAVTLELAFRFPTWAEFTHSFSRVLYPKRFPLVSPHINLTG